MSETENIKRLKETMSLSRKIEFAVQSITGIAVIIGVILVVIELRQTRTLTFSQMSQERLAGVIEEKSKVYGDNLGDVFEKSCLSPEALTVGESLIMHAYFENQIDQVMRVYILQNHGVGFDTAMANVDWTVAAAQFVYNIQRSPAGIAWLKNHPFYGNPKFKENSDIVAYLNAEPFSDPIPNCGKIKNWMAAHR